MIVAGVQMDLSWEDPAENHRRAAQSRRTMTYVLTLYRTFIRESQE